MLHELTKLPTPYGWTTVRDLAPGTSVFDELGYPVFVQDTSTFSVEKVHRVHFTNRSIVRGSVLMTESQILKTWNRDEMKALTRKTGINTIPTDWAEFDAKPWTLGEVSQNFEAFESNGSRKLMHVIPAVFPLVLPSRDVPVPPYIVGLTRQIHNPYTGVMTCKEHMWDWYEKQFVTAGYEVTRTKKRLKRYKPMDDVSFSSAGLNEALRRLGWGTTSGLIPEQYLRGSAQQRMELLQGLLDISFSDINTHGDTNSMFNKQSSVMVWCGQNQKLSEQVVELVRSLGYVAVVKYHPYAKSYTVSYQPVDNPYRYPKFRAELPDLKRLKRNTFSRFCWRVHSIEPEGEARVRSFEVSSPSGLVAVSDLFLPVVARDK